MDKKNYWNLFLRLGSVDSYLMYKLIENNDVGENDGGSKNTRIDTQFQQTK